MTDKEIIINGVDVSGCDCKYCMENPTCYKEILEEQSARKDERIKSWNLSLHKWLAKFEKSAHENGELKQKLSRIGELCNEIEDRDFNCTLPIDCDTCELNEACNEAFQQDRAIYFEKLQQIKHIAQEE